MELDEALNQIKIKQWYAKHLMISNHDLKSNHVFKSESWRALVITGSYVINLTKLARKLPYWANLFAQLIEGRVHSRNRGVCNQAKDQTLCKYEKKYVRYLV